VKVRIEFDDGSISMVEAEQVKVYPWGLGIPHGGGNGDAPTERVYPWNRIRYFESVGTGGLVVPVTDPRVIGT
jgi:hypothetical protein